MSSAIDAMHASYFLAMHRCPKCDEEVFAAEGATLVPIGIEFQWRCDLCDYEFRTIQPNAEPVGSVA